MRIFLFLFCVSSQIVFTKCEGFKISEKVYQIRNDTVNSIKKAFESNAKLTDAERCQLLRRLGQIAIIEAVRQELDQFADGMSNTKERKWHFLERNYENLVQLKEKLKFTAQKTEKKDGFQMLVEHFNAKIDQAIQFWRETNGQIKRGDQKLSKQIVEMNVKIKLIELMKEANLDTLSMEYEKIVAECGAMFGNTVKNFNGQSWANVVKEWNKMMVDKFLQQIDQSIGPFLSMELPKNQQFMRQNIFESLNGVKKGQMPSETELKSHANYVLDIASENANLEWENVTVYDMDTVSNWQLVVRGLLTLCDLFDNGIWHDAKSETNGQKKEKKHQQNDDKNEENGQHRNIFEQWLNDNAQLIKSVHDRLFPEKIIEQLQKRRRRRRKVDWNAWLHCISLLLLIIIMIWLIIALLALCSSGSSRGGDRRYRTNNSSRREYYDNSPSKNNVGYRYGGGYGRNSDSTGTDRRPTLTYWNSCDVVWYDLRH